MVKGSKSIDSSSEYYFYSDGEMATGWIKESNDTWDYFDEASGKSETGWIKDSSGKWYYLNADNTLKTGWQKMDGNGTTFILMEKCKQDG